MTAPNLTPKEEEEIELTPQEKIEDVLSSIGAEVKATCRVYRENPKTGKWEHVKKFSDISSENPPEPETLGNTYGGGEYKLMFQWPDETKPQKRAMKTVFFSLASEYSEVVETEREKRRGNSNGLGLAEVAALAGAFKGNDNTPLLMQMMQQSNQQMMAMVQGMQASNQAFMQMMLQSMAQNAPKASQLETTLMAMVPGIATKFLENHNSTADKMLGFMEKGMQMAQKVNELAGGKVEGDEPTDMPPWMVFANNLVDKAGMVLSSFVTPRHVQAQLQANPQAREILSDAGKRAEVRRMIQDKYSDGQAKTIIAKTGLDGDPTTATEPVISGVL